ncbi:hypothetical protein ACUN24_16360 [Pedobacter sp. WC2501]|uniref:hypothetical protein n=1 Tax=Pedobacter sp. WC2501 TaxID=3461400 RepID=UPI0040452036
MEVEMSKIHSYYKFQLIEDTENCYSILPIGKVYNHPIFNAILEVREIEVKFFNGEYFGKDQYVFTIKVRDKSIPICIIELTQQFGALRSLVRSDDTEEFTEIAQYGYGRLSNGFNDAILIRVTRDLIFEVFVCRGRKKEQVVLLNDFIYGILTDEAKAFTNVLNDFDGCNFGDLPDISPDTDEFDYYYNINLIDNNDSL